MVFDYVIALTAILINDYTVMNVCLFRNIGSLLVDGFCVYVDTKCIEDKRS